MEWKSGMKVRCIKSYGCFNVGDVYELTKFSFFATADGDMWDTNPSAPLFIAQERLKTNWEVVDMGFTKDDLKVGMLIELKDGRKYIVMNDRVALSNSGFINLCSYANDLTYYLYENIDYNIVKVYSANYNYGFDWNCKYRELSWEREEGVVKELTMEDLEREYGCKVKIVKE